jgi:hypothetical protein
LFKKNYFNFRDISADKKDYRPMPKQRLYQAKTRKGMQLDAIQEYGRIIKKRNFDEPPQIIKKKDYDEYFAARFGRLVNPV